METIFLKLVLAAALGGLIGIERQVRGQYAGFRTQLLVCLGSSLFTIVSIQFYEAYGKVSDPGRIAAQIVTGIGFLGAGAILHQKDYIRGLTTAATLWVVSAIGMTVGFGQFLLAGTTTLLVLVSLIILKGLEDLIFRKGYAELRIRVTGREGVPLAEMVRGRKIKITHSRWKGLIPVGQVEQEVSLQYRDETQFQELLRLLRNVPELIEMEVE
jgi:putative Mg2+ transporter-C (MgtC) family protein